MKKIIIAIFALCILNSCDKELLDLSSDEFNSSELKSSVDPKTDGVTVPFKSKFYTENDGYPIRTVTCEAQDPWYQMGDGNATHLGKFTTKMDFCMDKLDNPSPGGIEDGNTWDATYYYNGVEGSFIAANGDRLDFIVPVGEVRLNYLGYVMWWNDDFYFTGGTGRFVGVSGGGSTNSFSFDGEVHNHNWSGEITLIK